MGPPSQPGPFMEDNSSRLHSGESDGGAGRVYDWEDFLCSREVSGGEEESVYLDLVLTCLSGILSSAPSAPLDGPLAGGLPCVPLCFLAYWRLSIPSFIA